MTLISTDQGTFGELLKAFRKRRHLTQQQLAGEIGVHRSAIVRWEQGDFLPQSKALVLEAARCLHLDEQESRHLLEASLIAPSPPWYVPVPRNLFFTGRENALQALHTRLGVDQAVALTQSSALQGLGGIGKTQIALEYAYRHALSYSGVFWIGAETSEQIVSSFLRIAEVLGLPEREAADQDRVVTAVQRWLMKHSQWLLICDNVEDLSLLDRFLPSARQGAILVTTRCRILGTFAYGIDLLPMEQEEGMLFLLRRAKVLSSQDTSEQVCQLAVRMPDFYAAASELVRVLGGLPLALDQAGAYLEETQCGLPAYLELFRSRRIALLQQRGTGSHDHPPSVWTTLTLAIAETVKYHPAIWDLLHVCALLQPDAIPEELFRRGAEHFGILLEGMCRDALDWNRVIAGACAYSLLQRQPEEQTLSMHRLVQAALLDAMTEAEQDQWSRRTIGALDVVFPEVLLVSEYAAWKQAERLLPHALVCLSRVGAASRSSVFASLAYKTAQYLRERGQYAQAEPLFLQALQIRERTLGADHPEVASSLNALAILYREQGKYAQAEPLFLQALQIRERTLGADHPEVASLLNSLAALSWNLGRYEQAEHLLQRALPIWEQALGPEHPEVARPLNNLGLIYGMQGKYARAEPLLLRALHVWELSLGAEHPLVADALHNLAELSRDQGKDAQAESLLLRVVSIREQILGTEHPLVASALHDLAEIYLMQDNYTQAEHLYQRALSIREQSLGAEHCLVAEPLNGLANLFREQSKYAEAEQLYQRALSIREQHLGQCHPETAQTLHDLAAFWLLQDKWSEALPLAHRALAIRTQSLGAAHPKTVATQTLYAQLLQKQADTREEVVSPHTSSEKLPDSHGEERQAKRVVTSFPETGHLAPTGNDPVQEFLDVCCELHPLAWCRIRDLWQAYEQWTTLSQGCVPLSRRAFAVQVKARGCRVDRTSTARIWRGIRLVDRYL